MTRRKAPPVQSYLVTMSRKRLGGSIPEFQFIAQPDESTANYIAGCVLDAMTDASGAWPEHPDLWQPLIDKWKAYRLVAWGADDD